MFGELLDSSADFFNILVDSVFFYFLLYSSSCLLLLRKVFSEDEINFCDVVFGSHRDHFSSRCSGTVSPIDSLLLPLSHPCACIHGYLSVILESVVSCLLFISYFTIKAGFLSQVETGLLLPFVIGSLALIACLMSLVLVSPQANFSVNAVFFSSFYFNCPFHFFIF